MNADFRDGYAVRADQQLAGQAGVGRDLLSHRRCSRARPNLTHHQRRDGDGDHVRRPPRHRRQRHRRRRDARVRRPRDHRQPRRHSFAGDADALRHRPGGASARARHRGARRPAGRRRQPVEPFAAVHRLPSAAARRGSRRRCGRIRPRCCAFPPACRAVRAPTCTSTCRARPRGARSARGSPISRRRCGSRWGAAAWRCARPITGSEPLVEMNFAGHELDLKRLMVGFRLAVEMLAYRQGAGDERRDLPGEVHRPAAPAQPEDLGQCGQGAGDRLADRSRAGAGRAGVRHARRPQGRSRPRW